LLQGQPASEGVAHGRAFVLSAPSWKIEGFAAGDILIADDFDLGFSPLLLLAGGLVLAGATVMSAGLLLARELGIPAVVQARDVMSQVRPGVSVRVDGTSGRVDVGDTT